MTRRGWAVDPGTVGAADRRCVKSTSVNSARVDRTIVESTITSMTTSGMPRR